MGAGFLSLVTHRLLWSTCSELGSVIGPCRACTLGREMTVTQSGGSASYKDDTGWVVKNRWVSVLFELWKAPM